MEDQLQIARELGHLTEAVLGLRRDVQEFKDQRANLSQRVSALENFKAWTKGAGGALGGAVAVLGIERLAQLFHRG